ncbi:unnamed protein product [Ectocarpus sp. 12 AP-2014]
MTMLLISRTSQHSAAVRHLHGRAAAGREEYAEKKAAGCVAERSAVGQNAAEKALAGRKAKPTARSSVQARTATSFGLKKIIRWLDRFFLSRRLLADGLAGLSRR